MEANYKKHAPVPWLLIALVVATVLAAVFASTNAQRLVALGIAEVSILAYFCVGLMRTAPRASKSDAGESGAPLG